ncbi:MAG: hypothetical protein ACYDH9_26860 [Limisphaerales bacterium]
MGKIIVVDGRARLHEFISVSVAPSAGGFQWNGIFFVSSVNNSMRLQLGQR